MYYMWCVFSTEEILSSNSAMWFSPEGGRLAFATFNDSLVDTMNFPLYGQPGELPFQYPFQQSIKYPKVIIMFVKDHFTLYFAVFHNKERLISKF